VSNKFRHSICDECWHKLSPESIAHRLKPEYCQEDVCCFCGEKHRSGIYVMRGYDAGFMRPICKGDHD